MPVTVFVMVEKSIIIWLPSNKAIVKMCIHELHVHSVNYYVATKGCFQEYIMKLENSVIYIQWKRQDIKLYIVLFKFYLRRYKEINEEEKY